MGTDERKVVGQTAKPVTVDSLSRDFNAMGVRSGMTLLVHSSLSQMGWVCGGPVAVILSLLQVLGPEGTLVMPTHSGDLSDPRLWQNPPVPEDWWPTIYDSMPAFRPDLTPTRGMGRIAETFRSMQGVKRSNHPQVSFAAIGPQAETITARHGLAYSLGEESPLAHVYALDGWVMLLGVGHGNNTSLHLAEMRAEFPDKKMITTGAPVTIKGKSQWTVFEDLAYFDDDFPQLGEDFARDSGKELVGKVGQADTRLMPQRALVDYAVGWLEQNRGRQRGDRKKPARLQNS